MTTSTATPRLTYLTADSSTTAFTFNFDIADANSIAVYVGTTLQTITTDYTVAFDSGTSGTGTVTLTSAPASGTRVYLIRDTDNVRAVDFAEGGAFLAATINNELDRLTQGVQDVEDILKNKVIRIGEPTVETATLTLPAAATRANSVLGFDGSGNVQAQGDITVNTVTGTLIGNVTASSGTSTFNDVTVNGNLTVEGNTTVLNSTVLEVEDNIITLNSNISGAPSTNAGIEVNRGTSADKQLIWDESTDKWTVGTETFVAATFEGALTGNTTGTHYGAVVGDVVGDLNTGGITVADNNITASRSNDDLVLSASGTGTISVSGTKITNVSDPTSAQDAATKAYVDSITDFGNINISGNSITSTDTNGNINITPNGTGDLVLDGVKWPQADGSTGQVLKTDGAGQLSWGTSPVVGIDVVGDDSTGVHINDGETIKIAGAGGITTAVSGDTLTITGPTGTLSNVVEDTTPQLGGNLDVNGYSIVSTSNGNINISPNGGGTIRLDAGEIRIGRSGSNTNITSQGPSYGDIYIRPNYSNTATIVVGGGLGSGNNNIYLLPEGTGKVLIDNNYWPNTDGTAGQVLKTDGLGNLSWIDFAEVDFTFVGDDSTGTTVSTGETFKFAGATNITTAVSGDTLTITGPDLTSYTQNTDTAITVVGDDSTGTAFTVGETLKIAGANGLTTSVTGDTLTVSQTSPSVLNANLDVNGWNIISSVSNQNIVLEPNAAGNVELRSSKITFGTADPTAYGNISHIYNHNTVTTPTPTPSGGYGYVLRIGNYYNNASQAGIIIADHAPGVGGTGRVTIQSTYNEIDPIRLQADKVELWNNTTNGNNVIEAGNGNLILQTYSGGNTNILIDPDGTGKIRLDGLYWPTADGTAGQALVTNGSGTLSWGNPTAQGITFVGDDSTGTRISDDETVKIAGVNGITTSMSGDTLTIDGSGLIGGGVGDFTFTGSTMAGPSNADINIVAGGTGDIHLDADTVRIGDANTDVILTSNGATSGNLTIKLGSDATPYIKLNDGGSIDIAPDSNNSTNLKSLYTKLGDGISSPTLTTNGATNLTINTNTGTDTGSITLNTGVNGNIDIQPNGSGDIKLLTDTVQVGEGGAPAYIRTPGAGNLRLDTNLGTNSGYITITQGANANIVIQPDGTGKVQLDNHYWPNVDGTTGQVLTTNGAGVLSWVDALDSDHNFTFVGDDSTGTLVNQGETFKFAGSTNITTAVSGDTLTITGVSTISSFTNDSGYITASSTDTLTNKSGNISQWTNDTGYITNSTVTIVGDDSTGATLNTGETFKIAGANGLTTAVVGDTLTIDASAISNVLNPITFVGDDSTGTGVDLGETFKIAGGTNITTAVSGDTLTITGPDLSSYITASSTDTLTNKTINLTSNTLSGTTAQFNTALSDGDFATLAGIETLTNKTINSASNTITITESNISDLQSYITDVVNDTTPQLGGNLDLNSHNITGTGSINITGDVITDAISIADNKISTTRSNDILKIDSAGSQIYLGPVEQGSMSFSGSFTSNTGTQLTYIDSAADLGSNSIYPNPIMTEITLGATTSASNRIRQHRTLDMDMAGYSLTSTSFGAGPQNGLYTTVKNTGNATTSTLGTAHACAGGVFIRPSEGNSATLSINTIFGFRIGNISYTGTGDTTSITNSYGFQYTPWSATADATYGQGTFNLTNEYAFFVNSTGSQQSTNMYSFFSNNDSYTARIGGVRFQNANIKAYSSTSDINIERRSGYNINFVVDTQGSAGSLVGYAQFKINGSTYVMPYYALS